MQLDSLVVIFVSQTHTDSLAKNLIFSNPVFRLLHWCLIEGSFISMQAIKMLKLWLTFTRSWSSDHLQPAVPNRRFICITSLDKNSFPAVYPATLSQFYFRWMNTSFLKIFREHLFCLKFLKQLQPLFFLNWSLQRNSMTACIHFVCNISWLAADIKMAFVEWGSSL